MAVVSLFHYILKEELELELELELGFRVNDVRSLQETPTGFLDQP